MIKFYNNFLLHCFLTLIIFQKIQTMHVEKINNTKEIKKTMIELIKTLDDNGIKAITPDEIANFTIDCIHVIDRRINLFNKNQIEALEPEHIEALSSEQIVVLRPEQIEALRPEHIEALRPKHIKALSSEQIVVLRPRQIKALSSEQIEAFNRETIKILLSKDANNYFKNNLSKEAINLLLESYDFPICFLIGSFLYQILNNKIILSANITAAISVILLLCKVKKNDNTKKFYLKPQQLLLYI